MQLNGQRRDYGLGSAYDISLADARTAAADLRRRIGDGFDPVAERQKARTVTPNFEAATRTYHETLGGGWNEGQKANMHVGYLTEDYP